jgi:hypothetical protein
MVEIEAPHPVTGRGQGNGGVDGRGGLAGAALFIGEDDGVELAHLSFPR